MGRRLVRDAEAGARGVGRAQGRVEVDVGGPVARLDGDERCGSPGHADLVLQAVDIIQGEIASDVYDAVNGVMSQNSAKDYLSELIRTVNRNCERLRYATPEFGEIDYQNGSFAIFRTGFEVMVIFFFYWTFTIRAVVFH